MTTATIKKLAKRALAARRHAYAPYSHHAVGAALLADTGDIYSGANVETANYKGFCAEGSAIAAMASAGARKIKDIAVVGPVGSGLTPPCGDCRQRIREFADAETRIIALLGDGTVAGIYGIDELLPDSFGPEHAMAAMQQARHDLRAKPKKNVAKKQRRAKKA